MRRVCKLTGFVAGVVLLALPAAAQTPEEKAQEKDHGALRALRALYGRF